MRRFTVSAIIALTTFSTGAFSRADVVTDWNAYSVKAASDLGGNTGRNANDLTRGLTIEALAVNDAVASITRGHSTYLPGYLSYSGTPSSSDAISAAVAEASYKVLTSLPAAFSSAAAPGAVSTVNTNLLNNLNTTLGGISNTADKNAGIAVGDAAAARIIAARASDGSGATVPYTYGTNPGDYQKTPGAFNNGGVYSGDPAKVTGTGSSLVYVPFDNAAFSQPQYATVTPFSSIIASQFRSIADANKPIFGSAAFKQGVSTEAALGSATSSTRTADQTQIAQFWYPGSTLLWNQIASKIVAAKSLSVDLETQDLALVNLALGDSRIVAWDTKVNDGLERPITAIRNGDGNAVADANWTPLLPTPNHSSFDSGHGVSGGAAGQVLIDLFGNTLPSNFSISSDSVWLPGGTATRSGYSNVTDLIDENNNSRLYAGIHFSWDQQAGTAAGEALGSYIVATGVPEPSALGLLSVGVVTLLRRSRAAGR